MRTVLLFAFALVVPVAASAQVTVDTVGATSSSASGANLARGNLFRVDSSRTLQQLEMFLDISLPAQNLTWFVYRHHARTGNGTLVWSSTINTPAAGTSWYGSGPINVPLVAGNYYAVGVGWTGPVTFYWLATGPTPVSFGEWQSGRTLANPPPPVLPFAFTDVAQFRQRLTTVPLAGVTMVGTGCGGSALQPRLVVSALVQNGTTPSLHITDGDVFAPAVIALCDTQPLAAPSTFLGCQVWLPNIVAAVPLQLDAEGIASWPMPVPSNPGLVGFRFSAQALLQTQPGGPALTNALDLTVL